LRRPQQNPVAALCERRRASDSPKNHSSHGAPLQLKTPFAKVSERVASLEAQSDRGLSQAAAHRTEPRLEIELKTAFRVFRVFRGLKLSYLCLFVSAFSLSRFPLSGHVFRGSNNL
jgi:hypothetical protein